MVAPKNTDVPQIVRTNEIVAGFPEITTHKPQCRLCAYAQSHPIITHVVHELWGRQQVPLPQLMRRVKELFEQEKVTMPADTSFRRHLERHINVALITDAWRADGAKPPPIVEPLDDNESDYLEMRKLYSDIKPIIAQIRGRFVDKMGKDGTAGDISSYDVIMVTKLFAEGRQILKTLSDMRNSDRLTRVILVRHTKYLLRLLASPVSDALSHVRERLLRGDSPADVIEEIDQLLGENLSIRLDNAAKQAMEQSTAQYKLQ